MGINKDLRKLRKTEPADIIRQIREHFANIDNLEEDDVVSAFQTLAATAMTMHEDQVGPVVELMDRLRTRMLRLVDRRNDVIQQTRLERRLQNVIRSPLSKPYTLAILRRRKLENQALPDKYRQDEDEGD